MADGLSLRAFGRQLDVSGEAVRKAITSGKIPADCVAYDAQGRPRVTDVARATASWESNRNPNLVRKKSVLSHAAKRRRADHIDAPVESPASQADSLAGGEIPAQSRSFAIKAHFDASTARLDYEERVRQLVNADEAKKSYVDMVTAARNRLLGVPTKAKGRLPHLTVRDIEILEDLIAAALEEIAREEPDADEC